MNQKTAEPTIADLEDIAVYAGRFPPREPFVERLSKQVFQHPHVRWTLSLEQTSDLGYGLHRDDLLAERGVFGAEVDAKNFAKNLLAAIGDHMSLREAECLLSALQADVEERRKDRATAIARNAQEQGG
jgi:hypothetical protein